MMVDLVVISHLRWDFVWQRPQHLLSRLGKHYRIFFVEEPIATAEIDTPQLDVREEPNNVTVIRLLQPMENPRWIGHHDPLTSALYEAALHDYLAMMGVDKPVLWLYTPMAWHFTSAISHRMLIYDVMDELSAFKGAPAQLRLFDELTLSKANIVFTGGVSLYKSRRTKNPYTHLFPSGVEIDHFARAANRASFEKPADIAHLEGPILGYYGVIDERMDLPLLAHMAAAHPEWQLMMIGPVVKIDHADLPQAPNIHYLGMKTYQELPCYLAHFDVALVPFAINEATHFLSPTKTLEYMAAHKPIVSTPIRDIAALYGSVVRIAATPEDFTAQVEDALQADHNARRALEKRMLAQHTWDSIVQRMEQLIAQRLVGETTPLVPNAKGQGEKHDQPKWA
ncbi:MAG: glycosyltransferase [bacterium]|nr:glycosyltransferase [bacterium]